MKFKQIEDVDVSIDMSPMIDMVFLLLIFFLVAAAAVELDKPDVSLPSASQALVAEEVTGRMQVSIDRHGQYYVGSVPVDLDTLRERVGRELDQDPNLRLFIRADEQVPYRMTRELMNICADIGVVSLIYAAFEE